jgi:hypothetical protein
MDEVDTSGENEDVSDAGWYHQATSKEGCGTDGLNRDDDPSEDITERKAAGLKDVTEAPDIVRMQE